MSKTIVFVHGAWLTSLSWENFIPYFESKGYTCLAPEWPYRDKSIAELRENTPSEVAELGVTELVDHFAAIIEKLPEPPIIIGHSFGGIITQILVDRGYGSAAVVLDSVAPENVFAVAWSVLKANSGVLFGWMNWEKVVTMTFPEFQYGFDNTSPEDEQHYLYERYIVPESGRLFFQAAFAQLDPTHALRVDFKNNERAPLLLIVGEKDRIIPAHVAKSNHEHYKHSTVQTDFKEFEGRSHFIVAQEGWEEVADYIANWLEQLPAQSKVNTSTSMAG